MNQYHSKGVKAFCLVKHLEVNAGEIIGRTKLGIHAVRWIVAVFQHPGYNPSIRAVLI